MRGWRNSNNLTASQKSEFLQQMSHLLSEGIDLMSAVTLFRHSSFPRQIRELAAGVENQLLLGNTFSDALLKSHQFDAHLCSGVQAGEESGMLAEVLNELSQHLISRKLLKEKLYRVLAYPVFILLMGLAVTMIMSLFVIPVFEDLYKQQGSDLPLITRWIIMLTALTKFVLPVLIFLVIPGFFLLRKLLLDPGYLNKLQLALLKIPGFGKLVRTFVLLDILKSLNLLLEASIPLQDALKLVRSSQSFLPSRNLLDHLFSALIKGEHLSAAWEQHHLGDPRIYLHLSVGEQTNHLKESIAHANRSLQLEFDHRSDIIARLAEPVLMLLMGLWTGFLLAGLYLPIFKLPAGLGA